MTKRMDCNLQIINAYQPTDAFQRSTHAALMHCSILSVG
jgi:hypothetical protein